MKNSMHIPVGFKSGLAALLLSLLMSPVAISAGVYKWVDEYGKVHYGSQRPEDTQAERMKLHVPTPASQPETNENEGDETKEKEEAKLKDGGDPDKAKAERDAYCASERKRLQTVMKNKTIHQKDASGKVQELSAADRNQRLNKIRANIDKYCK